MTFKILRCAEEELEWNELCSYVEHIEVYDMFSDIVYYKYAKEHPDSLALDFVYYRRATILEPDKKYAIASRSVEHPKVPIREGFFRLGISTSEKTIALGKPKRCFGFPKAIVFSLVDPLILQFLHISSYDFLIFSFLPSLVELFPSGYIIEATGDSKCTLTLILQLQIDPQYISESNVGGIIRVIPALQKYIQRPTMDMNSQYLTRVIDTAYRDIYNVFTDSAASGWTPIIRDSNLALYVKESPTKSVVCTTGTES